MDKVTRLRKQLKDEWTEFRKLEDDHEVILDGRLNKDVEIQKTNEIKEKKDPMYNPALFAQTEEKNLKIKAHWEMIDKERKALAAKLEDLNKEKALIEKQV